MQRLQVLSRMLRTVLPLICGCCLANAASAFGYASDTSWAFLRFDLGPYGWGSTTHGTIATVTWELNPKYSRSGKCLKVEYCLGSDCNLGDPNNDFWSSWNTWEKFTISDKYNTVGLWVKRDNSDLEDRDLSFFFRMSDRTFDLCSPVPIVLTAADTAGRFLKIPMVSFRVSFDPKDTARPMPAGETWQTCLSIGARKTVVVGGVTHPKVPASGTLWFDDIGLFYDPASPDFPGPYVPYNGSTGTVVGGQPLRPVVHQERAAGAVIVMPGALSPAMRLYDLFGRPVPRGRGNRDNGLAHERSPGIYVGWSVADGGAAGAR